MAAHLLDHVTRLQRGGFTMLLNPQGEPYRCGHARSITSSARGSKMVGPIVLAGLGSVTNSILVDGGTGRSAGFAPLRVRPTEMPSCKMRREHWRHSPSVHPPPRPTGLRNKLQAQRSGPAQRDKRDLADGTEPHPVSGGDQSYNLASSRHSETPVDLPPVADDEKDTPPPKGTLQRGDK
jgi:hypothetical protein